MCVLVLASLCSSVCALQRASPPRRPPAPIGPNSSHPMASVVIPPRQLAPTVGPAAALAGVSIRTGSISASGERVVCGLVLRLGSLNFVSDHARCVGSRPFPRNGCLINFGEHTVYVATEVVCKYPEQVLEAEDPPAICAARGLRIARPGSCAEVMMTGTADGAGKGDTGNPAAKSTRSAKVTLERTENLPDQAGTSQVPVRQVPLEDVIQKLAVPVATGTDATLTEAELELHRQNLL